MDGILKFRNSDFSMVYRTVSADSMEQFGKLISTIEDARDIMVSTK